ncbi:hypothetical protein A3I35_03025 [Candidatus Falkowbacteria bacterium RIFCSPLOWO2_02_FULL_45_15]|uniref:DNA methylase N-4/N-6 domain-containing protein n=2 Tax=Candidatus Falkowiibacteriota TaxID=1752728 RepID=A0A1F5RZA9_9BACT|nr:MAG: hypothetical protein A3I35_03025 [Candidatus Falkowbacteria bacterium RIFCSPLOWO2_02_FULL_45_15]OGF19735.1 MAG: hypothetical protein A3D54_02415 [Candidatus Falkowbacteria bacterium RIFCSPHIGHO2_02_FULL_45_15]
MAKIDYTNWSQKDLITEIERLKKRKKYGLVWEDKPENVVEQCRQELPILEEVPDKEIKTDPDKPVNLLIEGDNYHALSVLNYTHKSKVDVIYIDPPYNTGNKSWKYNNRYVDREDAFKHSKFMSFLSNRIRLAKSLLSMKGIIICAIDDYEEQNVRHLFDDVFGEENRLGTIVVIHNPGGRQDDKFFATAHEYMLVYAKNSQYAKVGYLDVSEKKLAQFKYEDEWGKYKLREFRRSGANSRPEDRPNLWYPIYIDPKSLELTIKASKRLIELLPIDSQGIKRVWRWNSGTFMEQKEKYIEAKKNKDGWFLYVKERLDDHQGQKPKTVWNEPYYSSAVGTSDMKNILGKEFNGNKIFDFPKSKFLIRDIISITSSKNSLILDFFAGSGTSGQSVLELNKKDGGQRAFILCTNNEDNNGDGIKIATDICYPRIKNTITGYITPNNVKIGGIGGNLKYFRTAFVPAEPTDNNKTKLTEKATEMLCIREDTFELVINEEQFKIFKGKEHHTGIIFNQLAIPDVKKVIAKIDSPFSVYVFSLGDDTFEDEFADIGNKVTLSPIPEAILRVYRRIFK